MQKIIKFFRKRPYLLIFGFILIIAIFFRTYELVERYHFDHDSDLFSWIVKDIVVNHHPRLLGQLTSAPGIFIGPTYYYLLVPFFLIFNMDPIAAAVNITVFGILTIISYYIVFSRLFNYKVGLIASFVYSILIPNIDFDRRVVPSTPANLWVVWYFFTIINISRGNYSVLPLLGVLIGLIWHIHIALIPALIAIPVAGLLAKKLPNKKQVIYFLLALTATSIPLIAFELRHGFSQTLSLIGNFSSEHPGDTGIPKLMAVLNMIGKNVNSLYLSPQSLPEIYRPLFATILLTSTIFIVIWKKLLSKKEIVPLIFWILGVIGFFTVSSTLISEYYFYSVEIIFLTFVSLVLYFLYKSSTLGKILVLSLLSVVLVKNLYFYTTTYIYHKGYLERKAVAEYIKEDSQKKGFPCVGISYITAPGENVGFRYFFYLLNMHIVHPSLQVPTYNIVIPEELSSEVTVKFEHIGIIPPNLIPPKDVLDKTCQGENTNLTDPMLGYVE